MFLNQLAPAEKDAFLELAYYVAHSDSDFSIDQQDIIKQYCLEMNIKDNASDVKTFDLDATLSKFKNNKSQRIILLEIMALIYSDEHLHNEEKIILDAMSKKYKLNDSLTYIYSHWSKATLSLYLQGQALIDL
jgi:hypothetical protein